MEPIRLDDELALSEYRALSVVELTLFQLAFSDNEYCNLVAARCPTLTPDFARDELHNNPIMDQVMEDSLLWERDLGHVTFEQALVATEILVADADGLEASARLANEVLSTSYDVRCALTPEFMQPRVFQHSDWTKAEIELDIWATGHDFAERLYAARSVLTHPDTLAVIVSHRRIPLLYMEAISNLNNPHKGLVWDRTASSPAGFDPDFFARQIAGCARAELLEES